MLREKIKKKLKNRHGYKKVIKYLKINESLIITKISFFFFNASVL